MHRRNVHRAVLAVWSAVFLLFGLSVWDLMAGHLMIGIFLGMSLAVYLFAAFTIRCPACRMPVLLKPRKFLGASIYTWRCLIPEKCAHCGKAL